MLAFSSLYIGKTSLWHCLVLEKGGATLYSDALGGCLPFFAVDNAIVCEDTYTDFLQDLGDAFSMSAFLQFLLRCPSSYMQYV